MIPLQRWETWEYFLPQPREILAKQSYLDGREWGIDKVTTQTISYHSTADNYNLATYAKLMCKHMFKPKLAKLPIWTDSNLHIVHRVHNLILHPESTYLLYSKARQQSESMGSTQTCHHLSPQLLPLMSCQKDPPKPTPQLHASLEGPDMAGSQDYRTTRMTQ